MDRELIKIGDMVFYSDQVVNAFYSGSIGSETASVFFANGSSHLFTGMEAVKFWKWILSTNALVVL